MDWITLKSSSMEYIKKYRYVLLVLLAGIFLMALPEGEEPQSQPQIQEAEQEHQPELQDSLADILSLIQGAGKVKVLLTQAAGEQTLYQMDEDVSSGDLRQETVLVTNSAREETGLIKQVNPPIYQGAIVLCQGADSANVRLSIVEAVMSVTGLTSDHITVLKMK